MIWFISYIIIAVTIVVHVVQAVLMGIWWLIVQTAKGILWLDNHFRSNS